MADCPDTVLPTCDAEKEKYLRSEDSSISRVSCQDFTYLLQFLNIFRHGLPFLLPQLNSLKADEVGAVSNFFQDHSFCIVVVLCIRTQPLAMKAGHFMFDSW